MSIIDNKIPIQNIYYMLSYCAGILPEKDLKFIDGEDQTNLLELYVQALIRRLTPFVKRGFYKEYVPEQSEMAALKGKVLFKESVAEMSMLKGRLVCQYDEFSEDIVHNQIIKTTLYTLLRYRGLKKETVFSLKKLYPFFQNVRIIKLEDKHFSNIRLHKNNRQYDFIVDICYIIFQNLLINENEGTIKFGDYNREEKMNAVFEEFVRKFYSLKCKAQYKVSSEKLSWRNINIIDGDLNLIPGMQTDITLKNAHTKMIIDTKYYKKALGTNYKGDPKIKSENLYQLFSYLNNTESREKMIGILLYPQTDQIINQIFEMNGYLFKVMTVNLNEHWSKIDTRLMEIIQV